MKKKEKYLDFTISTDPVAEIVPLLYEKIKSNRWKPYEERQIDLLATVLANLKITHPNGETLRYMRTHNKSHYSVPIHGYSFRTVNGLMDRLEEKGLIAQVLGFRDVKRKIGMGTIIIPTEDLEEYLVDIDEETLVRRRSRQRVIVHLTDTDKRFPPPDSTQLREMQYQLEDYHELMKYKDISLVAEDNLGELKESDRQNIKSWQFTDYKVLSSTKEEGYATTYKDLHHFLRCFSGVTLFDSSEDWEATHSGIQPVYRLLLSRKEGDGLLSLPERGTGRGIDFTKLLRLFRQADIVYKDLHRVFNDVKLKTGGRFYGGPWMPLSEEARSKLRCGDEPFVEWDYSGLSARLLYHKCGIDYHGDPYDLGQGIPRDIGKIVSMVVLNAKNRGQAIGGIHDKFEEDGLDELYGKRILNYRTIRTFVSRLEEVHGRISQYFYKGVGLELMRDDSDLASDIIGYFIKKDVPILPVHDSFLVPERYRDELRDVMEDVYKKRFGFSPTVK